MCHRRKTRRRKGEVAGEGGVKCESGGEAFRIESRDGDLPGSTPF